MGLEGCVPDKGDGPARAKVGCIGRRANTLIRLEEGLLDASTGIRRD